MFCFLSPLPSVHVIVHALPRMPLGSLGKVLVQRKQREWHHSTANHLSPVSTLLRGPSFRRTFFVSSSSMHHWFNRVVTTVTLQTILHLLAHGFADRVGDKLSSSCTTLLTLSCTSTSSFRHYIIGLEKTI